MLKAFLLGTTAANRLRNLGAPSYASVAYGGGADPNWADCGLLIDFPYLYSLGVRPGDTVYDMTGRHQFTIPADSDMTADGWKWNTTSQTAITITDNVHDFAQSANWYASVIWNPEGDDQTAYMGNMLSQWGSSTAEWNWTVRHTGSTTGAPKVAYKQHWEAGETDLAVPGSPGFTAWVHTHIEYTDKQRFYSTGATYSVYSTNVTASADFAYKLEIGANVRHRIVRIGRTGTGGLGNPGSSGSNPVPTVAQAFTTGYSYFDPHTGSWSPATFASHWLAPLFAGGEDGIVLDPTRKDTMWTDSAMTTNVAVDGDNVYVWEDARGTGRKFEFTSATPPQWYSGAAAGFPVAAPYVNFNGSQYMYYSAEDLNFPVPTFFMRFESQVGGRAVIEWPQAFGSNTSPFFRNAIYHQSSAVQTRWNGTVVQSANGILGSGLYPMIGIDPANGKFYHGLDTIVTTTPVNPITYTAGVGIVLGANGGYAEVFTGKIFGFVLLNRAAVASDITRAKYWQSPLFATPQGQQNLYGAKRYTALVSPPQIINATKRYVILS